jgi:hypothetical protein
MEKHILKERELLHKLARGQANFEVKTGIKPKKLYIGFIDFQILQNSEVYAEGIRASLKDCFDADDYSQRFNNMIVYVVNVENHIGFSI